MKYFILTGLMFAVCVPCFSRDNGLRTATGILNLVDSGLRILAPKPEPAQQQPAAVQAQAVPEESASGSPAVCAYPENSYVAPAAAPWHTAPASSSSADSGQLSDSQQLSPAKVPWQR